MRKIKVGDTVKVMIGKDAGKEGKVEKYIKSHTKADDSVIVTGLNMVKKSQKPNPQFGVTGGILEFEKPINVSNVMLVEGKKAVRVGFKLDKSGKRTRISKKTGKAI